MTRELVYLEPNASGLDKSFDRWVYLRESGAQSGFHTGILVDAGRPKAVWLHHAE